MLPARLLALILLGLVAVPASALLVPAFQRGPGGDGAGGPLTAPDGHGILPAEGALGSYGCAHPARVADVLAGRHAEGASVCLEPATVVAAGANRTGTFTVRTDAGDELAARVSQHWWQHGTPAVGMVVVVQGNLTREGGAWRVDPVARWVDLEHPGPVVDAWRVAAGQFPENTYVWVNWTTVFAVFRNNDGDNNVGDDHVETGTVCPTAHLTTEVTPPYFGLVSSPPIGATVRLYGAVRYDDGHGWWEIHPIRGWLALNTTDAAQGCPGRLGESGVPPPGIIPGKIPPWPAAPGAQR